MTMASVSEKTIAAISTPQAPGGIGIIRISGARAREVAEQVFRSASGKALEALPGYACLYGRVYDTDGEIDECVAINYRGPKSFTGEDVVELSCHGGLYLLRRCLNAVFAAGAVPAQAGEFTRRAFMNGKISLTQAESVMELISAQGRDAARAALAGREGVLEKRIQGLRELLVDAAAHLSAWADYPDDDIPQVDEEMLKTALGAAKTQVKALLDGFEGGKALREGVETVIAGRPNVGKSTLMNLLAGCERSIVTEYAGTTRDVVEETVLLGGVPLRLADTAGIRWTEDPVERIGVERARERLRTAQLILAVFDSSMPLDAEDRELAELSVGVPSVAVVNKNDLNQKIDMEYIKTKYKQVVFISALSGDGLESLQTAVGEVLGTALLNPSEGILFTERQRDAARRAQESIEEAFDALNAGMTLDAVTVSVEGAVTALLELSGERATEAVVDEVFARFCVGK